MIYGRENGWKCYNQREPLEYLSRPHVPEQLVVLQKVLRRMEFPVVVQEITRMSALRRDGHPSIYDRGNSSGEKKQLKDRNNSDCSHWCLPGVPDTWNEILNAMLWEQQINYIKHCIFKVLINYIYVTLVVDVVWSFARTRLS